MYNYTGLQVQYTRQDWQEANPPIQLSRGAFPLLFSTNQPTRIDMDSYYEYLYAIHEAKALLDSEKCRHDDKTRRFFSHKDFVRAQDKTRQDKTRQDKTRQDKE